MSWSSIRTVPGRPVQQTPHARQSKGSLSSSTGSVGFVTGLVCHDRRILATRSGVQ